MTAKEYEHEIESLKTQLQDARDQLDVLFEHVQKLERLLHTIRLPVLPCPLRSTTKLVDDATKPLRTRPPGPRYFPGRTPLNEITGGPIQPTDSPTALRSTTKQE